MADVHTAIPSAATRVELGRGSRVGSHVSHFQCLIVAVDAERRRLLVEAARTAGWEPVPCSDPVAGLEVCSSLHLQMAVVDLASAVLGEATPLLEQLALTSGLLLVVCGQEGETHEEVFVRQVGAWLYLPGGIQAEQMTMLCSEARALCTCEANQQTSRRVGVQRSRSPRG